MSRLGWNWSRSGLALLLCTLASAQEPTKFGEGPLRNDTFLPTNPAAEAELERGDRILATSRARGAPPTAETLDAWHAALAPTDGNDLVTLLPTQTPIQWPDPDGSMSRSVASSAVALLLRLEALEDSEFAAWTARFAPLADDALAAAPYDSASLGRIERVYPGTRAAALAALRLCDHARESGRIEQAFSLLQRAERHGALAGLQSASWTRQLSFRRRDLAPSAQVEPSQSGDWTMLTAFRLERRPGRPVPGRVPPLGLGLIPGAATSSRGDLLIQTARAMRWLDASAMAGNRAGKSRFLPLENWLDLPPERPFVPPASGGWPLTPLRWGGDFVIVSGRGRPARTRKDLPIPARGNHLVAANLDPNGGVRVRWSLAGPGLARPGIPVQSADTVLGQGVWEFQPGPVRVGETLVVLARSLPSHRAPNDTESSGPDSAGLLRLIGLDWFTGARLWSVDLARSKDLSTSDSEAVGLGIEAVQASMPLAQQGGFVFVGTHAGALACVDSSDGRVEWILRNQRRKAEERSWPGSAPPIPVGPRVFLTPSDSDFLYSLPAGAWPRGGLFGDRFPVARRQNLLLAGANPDGLFFAGRQGRHLAILHQAPGSSPNAWLYLGALEHFTGHAALGPDQLLIATNRGLMALDRRNGSLQGHVALPDLGAGVGGQVVPIEGGAVVIGADTIWVLKRR